MSFNQWTIQAHRKLELHNLKRSISPDQRDIVLVTRYQPSVGLLVIDITLAKDPVVTADGLLKLMFGRVWVVYHPPENGKASRPELKLNCPEKRLPIGIGCQRCEILG